MKTLKIQESTHKNLDNFKKKIGAASLGEAIDALFADYDSPELNITLESSHFLPVSRSGKETVKIGARLNVPISNLKNLRTKINGINLLQRTIVNLNGYCSLADHYKITAAADKMSNGLISPEELIRRINEELERINSLAENLEQIDSLPAKPLKL